LIQWDRNPVGSNRWFFDDFAGSGKRGLSTVMIRRGWVKSPALKVILPMRQEGALPFLSGLACKNVQLQD